MKLTRIVLLVMLFCATPCLAAETEEVNYMELAALMLRDGNLDRAIIALDQVDLAALELEGDEADLLRFYTLRGMAHLRRDEPEAAVDALEKAVSTGQAEAVVYIYLAQVYFQLQRYTDVLATLDKAGPSLDRISSVYHMRAQCNWLLDQYALALATLDVATEIFPEDKTFLRRKVFFLVELGLFQEAVAQGRVYLQESEGDLKDYVALGNALRAGGELDEAIGLLEQARLTYPDNTDIDKVLAHAYLDKGQINTAADLIFQASLIDPALTSEAAELYRRAGRPNRAMMLNGQIADQPTKFKQRLALLLELRRFEQAAAMSTDLKRVGLSGDQDIVYALAYAEFMVGDFDQAEAGLQTLTRPDLFRKAAELRRAMADCAQESWKCL